MTITKSKEMIIDEKQIDNEASEKPMGKLCILNIQLLSIVFHYLLFVVSVWWRCLRPDDLRIFQNVNFQSSNLKLLYKKYQWGFFLLLHVP